MLAHSLIMLPEFCGISGATSATLKGMCFAFSGSEVVGGRLLTPGGDFVGWGSFAFGFIFFRV